MGVFSENTDGWRFKPKTKDDMLIDPFQDEFFKTGYVGGIAHALLRETIQNTLDAKSGNNSQVKLELSLFRNISIKNNENFQFFFNGLDIHLKAPNNGINDRPDPESAFDFLVIEDFNTTGLEGNPERAENPDDGSSKENFFYFWRNYGRSGKSEKDRGRWGLGKTVFSAVSRINTFFGLTIRESDHRSLLLGQSVLKIHRFEDKTYMPYGRFGKFRDTVGEQYFPVPFEDTTTIEKFRSVFHLKRTTEPGFSIVVPYPYQEITIEKLTEGVIKQFFYPIMSGSLSVKIHENDRIVHLDRESILTLLENYSVTLEESNGEKPDINLIKLFHFAQEAIQLTMDEYVVLKEPENLVLAPYWNDSLFSDIPLQELRKKFDQGSVIGFRIPVKVQRKGHQSRISWFKAYVQRDGKLPAAENYFIREGITISGVSSFREKGIRGMVVIDEGDLTTMIGDAENPAHTEWQKDSSKFRDKYIHGPTTLNFVRFSLKEIIRKLMKPAEGVDQELLGEIFFIDIPQEMPAGKKPEKTPDKKKKGDHPEPAPVIDIERRPAPVIVSKISGGVRIYSNKESVRKISSVEVKFAYAVQKGNPLTKYRSPDFDLGKKPIEIQGSGYRLIQSSDNILKFEVTDTTFDLSVSGFDEHRDLIVKSSYAEVSL